MGKKVVRWDFRDVSSGIQKLREFLLGRKYIFHNRFPPLIAPRSIPPPDIPRGPEYKYSDQWYVNRNVLESVKPPVVAPVAEGGDPSRKPKKKRVTCSPQRGDSVSDSASSRGSDVIEFPCVPTPGMAWWFDGHCYYVKVPDVCKPEAVSPPSPCPPGPCEPPPPPPAECAPPPCPKPPEPPQKCPAELPPSCLEKKPSPCDRKVVEPPPPPPICDPCQPPDPQKKS